MAETIAMSSVSIDESDIRSVVEVLRSGRLSLGPKQLEFEQLMSEYIGVEHAVAVNSGTAALHLIVKSLGIGPGDEVLVPSFTFAASVNAFLFEGAIPVFVDIEPDTYNLMPDDVERKVTSRTKAIMAVDVFGHPVEWDQFEEIINKHRLRVIDDSCEALGAEYKGKRLGQFGDAAAFGFYPNKQMTTGEGGIIVTSNEEIARVCRSLRNQGRSEMGPWLQHERLGYNYRMSELAAALGCSQLRRIESFISERERVARLYTERLRQFDWVRTPISRPHVRMSWFVYVVTLDEGIDRDGVVRDMEERGIPVRAYFSPIHLQPYILKLFGKKDWKLAVTERIAARTIALPFHNNIKPATVDQVVESLAKAVCRFSATGK